MQPRDLKPHNILLAAKDRKGPGLGRRSGGPEQAEGGGGGGGAEDGAQVAPTRLTNMHDLAKFVLKISDMGLGKQLLNGQSRYARCRMERVVSLRRFLVFARASASVKNISNRHRRNTK